MALRLLRLTGLLLLAAFATAALFAEPEPILTLLPDPQADSVSEPAEFSGPYDSLLLAALPAGMRFDSLVAIKHLRILIAYEDGVARKAYFFSLGDAPEGHKQFQGDERTPEGLYSIFDRNPASICHKNLGISYPNPVDRAYARARGRSPGGDIKIHGLPNGQGDLGSEHLQWDWTNGCIAVTDEEIDELYRRVVIPSPILILP